jgi:hypothetical protein
MKHFVGLDVSVKETNVLYCGVYGQDRSRVKVAKEPKALSAVLKAQINKTDRNDARGIAQLMRVGLYSPVHVKTLRNHKLRMLLTHRKLQQSKAIAFEKRHGYNAAAASLSCLLISLRAVAEADQPRAMLVRPPSMTIS